MAEQPAKLPPAGWGGDHVGEPVPEFMSGDECLFCHRKEVGDDWSGNAHGHTVRRADPESPALAAMVASDGLEEFASRVEFVLGRDNRQRFLKRGEGYGQLDLLTAQWVPERGERAGHFVQSDPHHWDATKFGRDCAGCHATGVDPRTHSFSAWSLDCFACHGEVPDGHTEKGQLAHLSPQAEQSARVVTSICAQCHVRTGTSKSTGRPYPNNFVAGDNLFRDFRVDLSDEAIGKLNPGDAHVLQNVRDVVVSGKEGVTCLSCHAVHRPSGRMHQEVAEGAICLTCHKPGPKRELIPYEVHGSRCEY